MSSWLAAATSYSTNDCPMIPFYIYYSMFGSSGSATWRGQPVTSKARGFLLGATSGRTTLNGEVCSTKMVTATSWPTPSRTASPTIRLCL